MLVPAIKTASSLLGNGQTREPLLELFVNFRFKKELELLQLTAEDARLWSEDPQEFARRDARDSEVETPRSSMLNFLLLLTRPITVETERKTHGKKEVKVNSEILEDYIAKCFELLEAPSV